MYSVHLSHEDLCKHHISHGKLKGESNQVLSSNIG